MHTNILICSNDIFFGTMYPKIHLEIADIVLSHNKVQFIKRWILIKKENSNLMSCTMRFNEDKRG